MKNHSKSIIFDIECDSLKPTVIWCIVAKDMDENDVKVFGPDCITKGINYLQSADILVGHNIIGFDLPVIERLHDVKFTNEIIDTLVLSRLFQPIRENGHSLKTWGYRVNFNKKEQPIDFSEYSPDMLGYCKQDVLLNEKVYWALIEEARGFSPQSIQLEHEFAKLMAMQ